MILPASITIFGEVLFDCFPDGTQVLGGAPFNVAWHLKAFGQSPQFISRIGRDTEGDRILEAMNGWGIDHTWLQIDPCYPTGKVVISFVDNEPTYDIVSASAFDFIQSQELALQATTGILYHGSLALRSPASASALRALKEAHRGKIFVDVNLRSPWWSLRALQSLLDDADYVKLNEEELGLISQDLSVQSDAVGYSELMPLIESVALHHSIEILIVTRGSQGAVLYHDGQMFTVEPALQPAVVDTVGAGDGFGAVMLLGLHEQWPISVSLRRANTFASFLVTRRGATIADPAVYQTILQSWMAD
jgi:fructokinase